MEGEVRNRLWMWLEEEQGYKVWPEVELKEGKIDLVAKTPEEDYIGFETKGCPKTSPSILKQLKRYMESEYLDRVYFVSNNVEYLIDLFEDTNGEAFIDWKLGIPRDCVDLGIELASPDVDKPAIELVEEWVNGDWNFQSLVDELGIIHVPIDVRRQDEHRTKINEMCESILASELGQEPTVIREAERIPRTGVPNTLQNEVWLHYRLWREFGGLVEGAIPNPNSGYGSKSLNIDLVTFESAETATEALQTDGEVIGVEAKTEEGLKNTDRLREQLEKYKESSVLDRIYLAVPASVSGRAKKIITSTGDIGECVGVIGIHDNEIEEVREATPLSPEFDGYGTDEYPYYVGYGNTYIPDMPDPNTIYSN
ncbi:hypothetical protein [Salinigranum marinum]|uniref:hypothetical protein n=1 Tax=Salinigranum marinum TaxID=1515595 RepID=UPI002989A292|nr:hypothetical protein [Salinigranum marinum]